MNTNLLYQIGIFVVAIFVLIKAAGYFTDAAEKVGFALGMSAFIVGVTIVALGTSLPELVSSLFAVFQGYSEIVVGNVIGSNIANIFLVLGIAALLSKKAMKVNYELIHVDLPLFIGSAFLLAATIWDGMFTLPEAVICILAFGIYLVYTITHEEKNDDDVVKEEMKGEIKKKQLNPTDVFVLVGSAVFIYFGAKYTIESVISISVMLNMGKEIIAISAVALGTSLPELVVSVGAALKGKSSLAVGNVLGSNIFNALIVMGVPALFGELIIPKSILVLGLPMMLIAALLYFFMTQDKEMTKWEGGFLILFYILFIGKLFVLF